MSPECARTALQHRVLSDNGAARLPHPPPEVRVVLPPGRAPDETVRLSVASTVSCTAAVHEKAALLVT